MLSIIVSWRNRPELSQSLPQMIDSAQRANGDLTIVNFDGSVDMINEITREFRESLQVVHVCGEKYFNKAKAQNIGALCSKQPVLFFCDSDILLAPELVSRLSKRVTDDDNTFATLEGVIETQANSRNAGHVVKFGYTLNIQTADGRTLTIDDHEEDSTDGSRNAPGLLFVRRTHFLHIGGYNSAIQEGWGWEDQDMISRLVLGCGLARISEGKAFHISHDDIARLAHYPVAASRWESRDKMFRRALANYDRADFLGTYCHDITTCTLKAEPQRN